MTIDLAAFSAFLACVLAKMWADVRFLRIERSRQSDAQGRSLVPSQFAFWAVSELAKQRATAQGDPDLQAAAKTTRHLSKVLILVWLICAALTISALYLRD